MQIRITSTWAAICLKIAQRKFSTISIMSMLPFYFLTAGWSCWRKVTRFVHIAALKRADLWTWSWLRMKGQKFRKFWTSTSLQTSTTWIRRDLSTRCWCVLNSCAIIVSKKYYRTTRDTVIKPITTLRPSSWKAGSSTRSHHARHLMLQWCFDKLSLWII